MSTRNPKSWTVIAGTVREAQDVLCRLWATPDRIDYSTCPTGHHQWGNSIEWPVVEYPAGLPQSLGELCIELADDVMRTVTMEYNVPPGFWRTWPVGIQKLRETMWHKHRDPAIERREHLVDIIKDNLTPHPPGSNTHIYAGGTK